MKNSKFSTEVIEIPFDDVEFDDIFITSKEYPKSQFINFLSYDGYSQAERFFAFKIFANMRDYIVPENSKRRRLCKVIISFNPSTKIKIKRRGLEVGYYELLHLAHIDDGSFVFGRFDANISGNFVVVFIFCKRKRDETEAELKKVYVTFRLYLDLEALHFQDKNALLKAIESGLI